MSAPEHRNPLGQIPIDLTDNVVEPPSDPIEVAKPSSYANVQSLDDLASAMAQNLKIADDDDEFDEARQGKQETVDWKKENKEMDKMFESHSAQQLKDLPDFETPRGFKKTVKFYDHQKDGIRWLVQQEQNAPPNPFVRSRTLKDDTVALYDRLTKRRIHKAHAPVKGSILADDMGLGKTIQTLGLILSNPPEGYIYGKTDGADLEKPIATLIVCPKSVISNWITQSKDFCKPRTLNIVTYSGTPKQRSKIIDRVEDNEIDLLLATYETVSSEHEKDRPGLLGIHDVAFHRIVLDEAQQIRNPKSKCFKAIEAVAKESEYRLALTGTPFVNKPEDTASLLSFIGLEPLADPVTFKTFISDPIKDRKRAGLTRLRAALAYVALRRTKNIIPNLEMAEKTVNVCPIEFPEGDHKDIHDVLYLAAQAAFEASINGSGKGHTESEGGVTGNAQQAMFSLLTRVRQSCSSGALVSASHYEVASEVMGGMKDENGNFRRNLTAREGNTMIDKLQSATSENNERLSVKGHSPKVDALLTEIGRMQDDEKAVIFSQWTSYLDIIGVALDAAGFKCVRIDGSMSTEQRTQALEDLAHDDKTRFILCSLKAAGVGINLTRANVCFMMDPWWNAASEMQAIDRVHRFGQKRDVRVFRYVMKGTIEERMLDVQKAKSALGKGTMTKLSKAEESVAKVTSLKDLFQIKESDDGMSDFIDNSDQWF